MHAIWWAPKKTPNLPSSGEGPNGHELATEGFWNVPAPFAEAEVGLLRAGPAHDRPFLRFRLAQLAWQGTGAWPIAVRRHIVVQGLVWTLGIVDGPPTVECLLRLCAVLNVVMDSTSPVSVRWK